MMPEFNEDFEEDDNTEDFPAYRTEDNTFFFSPIFIKDEPEGRVEYDASIAITTVGGYWEPDDVDIVSIGRAKSLEEAIQIAAKYQLDYQMDTVLQNNYWEIDWQLSGEFPVEPFEL